MPPQAFRQAENVEKDEAVKQCDKSGDTPKHAGPNTREWSGDHAADMIDHATQQKPEIIIIQRQRMMIVVARIRRRNASARNSIRYGHASGIVVHSRCHLQRIVELYVD